MYANEKELTRIVDYLIAGFGQTGAIEMVRRRLVALTDPKVADTARCWRELLERLEEAAEPAWKSASASSTTSPAL